MSVLGLLDQLPPKTPILEDGETVFPGVLFYSVLSALEMSNKD